MTSSIPTKLTFRSLESKILYFNGMYKLPLAPYPTLAVVAKDIQGKYPTLADTPAKALAIRLKEFKKILMDEVAEVDDIILKLADENVEEIEVLTDLADWLGDIQVYCYSEMARWGIPYKETMDIIMDSNFSKLGADGKPILAEGKVQKGPFYWKPEPTLKAMLLDKIAEATYVKQSERN